ncbi:MAG TPA: hypothetical protein VI259_04160 [Gemmatimonadaceae bacterium]
MRARWVGLICAVPFALRAQGASPAGAPQLAPSLKAEVERLADSVRALGLPKDPLFAKASEGTLKGADEQRIMVAVRRLARELSDAKAALGEGATADELEAGASALHAGVGLELVARLGRAARDGHSATSAGRALTGRLVTPLVTLADMVARKVSPAAAVSSIEALVNRGAADAQYVALRSDVERDIAAGERPDVAMQRRSASIVKRLEK